jgi:threonine dehydratase
MINSQSVIDAYHRIKNYVHETSVVSSQTLNSFLGHEIFFKLECQQKIGAFKSRGAFNKLLFLKEQGNLPKQVVAVSSGNHAQGIALSSKTLGVKATIFMNKSVSPLKIQAAKSYGAEVILVDSNQEADQRAARAQENGAYFIHPFDDDEIIAGQGTACYEALRQVQNIDAVFAPCGGGGLLSGSFLASKLFDYQTKIYGGEPQSCNDASISLKQQKLHIFDQLPFTIADGIRTLSISERTFAYLKKSKGIIEVSEEQIIYWTQWLQHLLKVLCEPCSGVAMAACHNWLNNNNFVQKQRILIIISGGNIATESQKIIWSKDYLCDIPAIKN